LRWAIPFAWEKIHIECTAAAEAAPTNDIGGPLVVERSGVDDRVDFRIAAEDDHQVADH
jgi:hypothetical protein